MTDQHRAIASSKPPKEAAAEAFREKHPNRALAIFNGYIDGSTVHEAMTLLLTSESESLSLFLTTLGGNPHAAYRLARFVSRKFSEVRLLVSSECKSAGTLIAVGTNEIGFGEFGELGPLDVQMRKPDEIYQLHSGLDVAQSLGDVTTNAFQTFEYYLHRLAGGGSGISTRTAAEIVVDLAGKVYEPLSAQIDPARLAEATRANRTASEYGKRLDKGNLKDGALTRLIEVYPTHAFVIDRAEATTLFHKVGALDDAEAQVAEAFEAELRSPRFLDPIVYDVIAAYAQAEPERETTDEVNDGVGKPIPEANSGEPRDHHSPATASHSPELSADGSPG